MIITAFILFGLGCWFLGLWTYHIALGRAGFLGRLAARQAEKKLYKRGIGLVDLSGEDNNPNLPGRKTRNPYGKFGQDRKDPK